MRNKKVKQELFHAHFTEGLHQGESDWEVRLIDQGLMMLGGENLIGNMN